MTQDQVQKIRLPDDEFFDLITKKWWTFDNLKIFKEKYESKSSGCNIIYILDKYRVGKFSRLEKEITHRLVQDLFNVRNDVFYVWISIFSALE